MTNLDEAENRAMRAAEGIGEQARALWLAAHTDGVRGGLEIAATLADECAKTIANNYSIDAEIRAVSIHCLNEMRDHIRLTALQIPEPETPKGDGR